MAASSEIRYKIGADTGALTKGFAEAETKAANAGRAIGKRFSEANSVASAAGSQLERKLGMGDAFKATFFTLGLSIESIANKVAEAFGGGALNDWKRSVDAATESAKIIEDSTLKRLSAARQIETIEKKIASASRAGDENPTPRKKTGFLADLTNTASGFGAVGPFGAVASIGKMLGLNSETDAEGAARAAEATRDRLAAEARIADLKEAQLRASERIADAQRALERIGMGGPQAKLTAAFEDAARAEGRLEDARQRGIETTELELAYISSRATLKQAQIDADQSLADFAAKEAEASRRETEEMEKQSNAIAEINRQRDLSTKLSAIELNNGTELAKVQAKLADLREREKALIAKAGPGNDTPELASNRAAQSALTNQVPIIQRDALRERDELAARERAEMINLGRGLAGSRPDLVRPPRTRGRSERERIADRGAAFAARADAAIRSGASPAYVASLTAAANRDFKTVGGKVATSTSAVARDDAMGLKSELVSANKTLADISKNLAPAKPGKP